MPAAMPVVETVACQRWPVLVAATEPPVPSSTSTADTWSVAPAEAAYHVTGAVVPRVMLAPAPGVRTNAEGPTAVVVGASATPRNSVFAGAVAITAGGVRMLHVPAEPLRHA